MSSQNLILVQLEFLQSGVHEPMVQHVRLFVVMGGKNNIIDNVFECLCSQIRQIQSTGSTFKGLTARLLLSSSFIDGVSHTFS